MLYTIEKGKHRAKPCMFGIVYQPRKLAYNVSFDYSCRYELSGEDMFDFNKLFGVGFFFHHHTDSARFGWRYNAKSDGIDICSYTYINGNRRTHEMITVPLNENIYCSIVITNQTYTFTVTTSKETVSWVEYHNHKKKWAYLLGVFFGGNKTAPKTMSASLSKIK